MVQKNIETKDNEAVETTLDGMGFVEDPNKKDLFKKELGDNQMAFWDFRKNKRGRFYITEIGGDFVSDDQAKQTEEYIVVRQNIDNKAPEIKKTKTKAKSITPIKKASEAIVLRGTEDDITNVVQSRNLDLIRKASKDPKNPGKGILYYDEKIGDFQLVEPSVELVDLITAQMGNITVEILEKGNKRHVNIETGDEYQTYYAIVKATDRVTGTEGIGSAEEIIDFGEMQRKNNPRTFALTKAIRKAERNAKERLIPVPRRAMDELVKELLDKCMV